MLRIRVVFIVLLILMMPGCVSNEADHIAEEDLRGPGVYEGFLQRFERENLAGQGIDIAAIVGQFDKGETDPVQNAYLQQMNYAIEKCNLSQMDPAYQDDLLIYIEAKYKWYKLDTTVICAFVRNENGQYHNVLTEQHENKGADYEIRDITGDGKSEIVLTSDDSGNQSAECRLEIKSYTEGQREMVAVFDEVLVLGPYAGKDTVISEESPRLWIENAYEFVPARDRGVDIEFVSKIYEIRNQEDILAGGATRYRFDGNVFVPDGAYFDYMAEAERVFQAY